MMNRRFAKIWRNELDSNLKEVCSKKAKYDARIQSIKNIRELYHILCAARYAARYHLSAHC